MGRRCILDKTKDISENEEKLEILREKLNKDIVKKEYKSKDGYESLLATSRELDNVIVD